MGAWGEEPWENDGAADWFASFFEGIDAGARVRSALGTGSEEVLAAGWLLGQVGRVYVWPEVDDLGPLLDEVIAAVTAVERGEDDDAYLEAWEDSPHVVARVEAVREALVARRSELAR